jgi:hypothetical protein
MATSLPAHSGSPLMMKAKELAAGLFRFALSMIPPSSSGSVMFP